MLGKIKRNISLKLSQYHQIIDLETIERDLNFFFGKKVKIKKFTKGKGWYIKYIVEVDGKKYILKVPSKRIEAKVKKDPCYFHYSKRLQCEFEILKLLSEKNLTYPPVLLTDNYILREYIPGETLTYFLKKRQCSVALFSQVLKNIKIVIKLLNNFKCEDRRPIYDFNPDNIIIYRDRIFFIDFEHFTKNLNNKKEANGYFKFIYNVCKISPENNKIFFAEFIKFLNSELESTTKAMIIELLERYNLLTTG